VFESLGGCFSVNDHYFYFENYNTVESTSCTKELQHRYRYIDYKRKIKQKKNPRWSEIMSEDVSGTTSEIMRHP